MKVFSSIFIFCACCSKNFMFVFRITEFTYPIVRLPQSEIKLAGETAYIFRTEHNGKPVYVISLEEEFNGELKVVQPETKSDLGRIEALEKEVYKPLNQKKS